MVAITQLFHLIFDNPLVINTYVYTIGRRLASIFKSGNNNKSIIIYVISDEGELIEEIHDISY